jgi:8-amino-3,8-dideoxy-alpha-D-manno-octulosonate transaminase
MYSIDEREIDAIRRVFAKKKLLRYQADGSGECETFEKEFSSHIGSSHALLVTSGTNALIAALEAAGVSEGDEVILPAYTFVATAAAVLHVGAKPVIANVDETLGLSPQEVASKITPRTKALIPVHMDGLASDMEGLTTLASKHSLLVIEDVAQAIGGSYGNKRLGTWGDYGCFSLNENKNIGAGEGGIVVSKTPESAEKVLRAHDVSAQFNPIAKKSLTSTVTTLGGSMRVSEITGAIMRVQLERLEGILEGLRSRKNLFKEILRGNNCAQVIVGNDEKGDCASSLHLLFPSTEVVAFAVRKLLAEGLPFIPATSRPAHASWKWASLLGPQNYSAAEFLPSIDILTRTLKMEIDLHQDLAATEAAARQISKVLDSV